MQEVILNSKQLQDKLKYWQKCLRLQDWDIEAEIVPMSKLQETWHRGECEWIEQLRAAKIYILSADDYKNSGSICSYDMEQTLVHELLHLHFVSIDIDKYYMPIEQAIEAISRALISMERESEEIH